VCGNRGICVCGIKGKDNDMSHFSHNDIDNFEVTWPNSNLFQLKAVRH
jgi:hypothetical protein